MTETTRDIKRGIRERMKVLRGQLDTREYQWKSEAIAKRLHALPEWASAATVHIYVSSLNNEVDTLGIILDLIAERRRVAVPKCIPYSRRLSHIHLQSLEELKTGEYGIREPDHDPEREIAPHELDLIVAPLLAFDRDGGRIGFGGGYYDTLFGETACPRVGLAFAFQEVGEAPLEEHDGRLDVIVTESETIRVQHE